MADEVWEPLLEKRIVGNTIIVRNRGGDGREWHLRPGDTLRYEYYVVVTDDGPTFLSPKENQEEQEMRDLAEKYGYKIGK